MPERFNGLKDLPEIEKTKVLLTDLKNHHRPTYKHSLDVGRLAFRIASFDPALQEEERKVVYKSGLLHDIGKMAVPARVLSRTKETRLSTEDMDLLKLHGKIGQLVLDNLGFDEIFGVVADQHNIGIEKFAPTEEELARRHPLVCYISLADFVVSSMDSSRLYQPNYRPIRIILDMHKRFDAGYFPRHLKEPFDRTMEQEFPHYARLAMIKYGK